TVDTTVEAVIGGAVTNYGPQNRLMLDGVVCDSTFQFSPSDAEYSWGYAVGGCLIGQDMNNVIVNDVCNNNMIIGLSSGEALKRSKAKRYFNASNTAFCNVGGGCIVSSGLYDINFDHIYAAGGTGEIIRTRMPSGIHMFMSPMTGGITITNSRIENWGTTTGNWIYPNYVDPTLGDTWGLSAYCNGENFPAGIRYVIDNNVFKNIAKAGCNIKGYAMRLSIPAAMDNARLTFTNNTVTEDNMTGSRFIDLCSVSKEPGAYIKEENVDISGNTFINFSEPIRLSTSNGKGPKSDIVSLDENYFAKTENGMVTASPITAKATCFVSKSDWYYMNESLTVKDTEFGMDLSSVSNDFTVKTFPDFTVDAKLNCGMADIDPAAIVPVAGMTIEGFYADKACTEKLTGKINNNTFYAKTVIKDAVAVFTINLTKAAAHKWSEYVTTVEPGCTTEGTAVRTCENCAAQESKVVPALKHVESEPTYIAATCTENAGIYIVCVRCGEEISGTEIPDSALGHDWSEWEVTTAGSCTVDMVETRTCKRADCGEVEINTTTAPGHDWSDWVVTVEPTCEEEGVQIRECSVCFATETLSVAALGHDYETVVTEATCVTDGKEEQVCKTCGYVDESLTVVLPLTGIHTWGNFVVTEASCVSEGVSERFCTVCSIVDADTRETTPADPFNHAFDPEGEDWEVADEGDCVNPKILVRTCPDCGEVEEAADYEKVTGYHAYELKTTPSSYDQSGKYEMVCSGCGDTELLGIITRLPQFTDVDGKAWYADTLTKAAAFGIMKGYEDGSVRPDNYITRAEAISMVARVAGVDTSAYKTNKFNDVAAKAWYNGAIAWAEQNMIVSGRSENTFDPNGNINRQELCAILVRYADFAEIELNLELAKSKFADDAKIAKYAKESVYLCQRAGIVSGRPGNLFAPTAYATRAEVARIMVVFAEQYGLVQTESAMSKNVAILVENNRHASVVEPLEEYIASLQ
ncbi:MAG: S-layer homology domain-containing protein, partial [Clostridia bacterium]|nr:S-layer homology domain-containing protein [Clostridia bacterium]